ncbi:MAG: 30S ribosomal protein S4 [Candidatus Daviesbacteria bacterium]|nr:30S ribosomal protein S4 [Candidatus Daviesbacteria bacterium]
MARYTGPKRRLSKREGLPLFSKDIKAMERKGVINPGQRSSARRRKRVSEYGLQLREKQKAKRFYGILERQFRKYFERASKVKGATGLMLLELLERRLDNVVFRLGLAKSRAQARQLVTHGHISIDNKKINIPSYTTDIGQTIALSPQLRDNTLVKKEIEEQSTLPGWLEREATFGKVLRRPERDEMEQAIEEQLIVEYYSR